MNHLRRVVIKQAIQSEGGSQDGIDYHDRIIAALRSHDANLAEQVMRASKGVSSVGTSGLQRHKIITPLVIS